MKDNSSQPREQANLKESEGEGKSESEKERGRVRKREARKQESKQEREIDNAIPNNWKWTTMKESERLRKRERVS